jgi:hypothetical protein
MKQFFSDFFEISEDILEEYGTFNISLVSDLPLFIDPFLLFNSKKEEYINLHEQIIEYLIFLRDKSVSQKLTKGLIDDWYRFPEVKQNWFGYSKTSNKGSGLGTKFANALNLNFRILNKFGEERVSASHLEKLTLINSGVGRDNISDFTTNLIKEFLLNYSQDFARKHLPKKFREIHVIPKVRFNYKTESWEQDSFELPTYDNNYKDNYIILTPIDILTKDETWINRSELLKKFRKITDAIPNVALRDKLTNYFEKRLSVIVKEDKEATAKDKAQAANETILEYPEVLDYFVRDKEEHGDEAKNSSSLKVIESKLLYLKHFSKLGWRLQKTTNFYKIEENSFEKTLEKLNILKEAVENGGGNETFYFENKPIEDEDNLSILFRLTWKANHHKIDKDNSFAEIITSWKPSTKKLKIVLKLSTNSQIRKTLEKLRDVYKESSAEQEYILVLIHYSEGELNDIKFVLKAMNMSEHKNIVFINAARAEEIENEDENITKDLKSPTSNNGTFFDGFGLLVGVGADLADTVTDATGLYNVLVNPKRAAYPSENVQLLTEDKAKRQDILDGFDKLIKQSKEKNIETAVVYFSGHGGKIGNEYYLAPYGYNNSLPKQTLISGKEFSDKIDAIKAKKLIVILDCCRAGGIPITKDAKSFIESNPPKDFLDTLSKGSGKVIIASSQENESSFAGKPYSAFTKCLLEALLGKGTRYYDGYAKILDVLSYLFKEVPIQTKDKQHPFLNTASNLSENFAVCYYAGGLKEIPGVSDSAEQVTETTANSSTTLQTRLQSKLDRLNSNWKVLNDKIGVIQKSLLVEAGVSVKFQLQQELVDSEAELSKLELQIKEIEDEIGLQNG